MSDEFGFEESVFESDPEGGDAGELYRRPIRPLGRSASAYRPGRAGGVRPKPPYRPRIRARAAPPVRSWPRYRALPVTRPPPVETSGSERVRWVQDCLNHALGESLPITGFMGPETRSAVRRFQRRQGLRSSGIVGPDTEERLRVACRDGRGPPDDTQEESGPSGWRTPDGSEAEEEILVKTSCAVDINLQEVRELHDPEQWRRMYRGSGVYRIYAGEKTLYVGKANNVWSRFAGRRKVLSDLGLSLGVLEGRKVGIYRVETPRGCRLDFRRSGGRSTEPRATREKLLAIAETALVQSFKPLHTDSSKLQDVRVEGGTLTIRLDGREILSLGKGRVLTAKI